MPIMHNNDDSDIKLGIRNFMRYTKVVSFIYWAGFSFACSVKIVCYFYW